MQSLSVLFCLQIQLFVLQNSSGYVHDKQLFVDCLGHYVSFIFFRREQNLMGVVEKTSDIKTLDKFLKNLITFDL